MRLLCTIVCTLLCNFLYAADWVALLPIVDRSVPRIEISPQRTCSAVVYEVDLDGNAWALTAAHCVVGDDIQFTIDDRHATVEQVNPVLDLAICRYRPRKETHEIRLAPKSPPAGSEIAVVGYAFGIEDLAFQFGHITQTHNRETKRIWIDARIIFGDSGGAVVNTQGELVGISTSIFSQGPDNIGGAVSIETVTDFIDDFKSRKKDRDKK